MNPGVDALVSAIKGRIECRTAKSARQKRTPHVLIVGGNVRDLIFFGKNGTSGSEDLLEFIEASTGKPRNQEFGGAAHWPVFAVYDAFDGIRVIRGEESDKMLLGLVKPTCKNGECEPERSDSRSSNGFDSMMEQAARKVERSRAKAEESSCPNDKLVPFIAALKKFDGLCATLSKGRPALIVIDRADELFCKGCGQAEQTAAAIALLNRWIRDRGLDEAGHLIVLLCRETDKVVEALDRPITAKVVRIQRPDLTTRKKFLSYLGVAEASAALIAGACAGLTLKEIRDIAGDLGEGENAEQAVLDRCFDAKRRVIQEEYGDLMEVVRPSLGFEVIGGIENVVDRLKRLAKDMRFGRTSCVPMGVLLMGPPGTGKTLLAEALAKDAGVNFVRLLDIKSKWVGESEQRMTRLLHGLRELAPVVVFVDEFDQEQGKRGGFDGDSGVSKGLFKKMLEFMSDTTLRGKVLWLLATNRPDLIDPAMMRTGRCDLRVPLLAPDAARLAKICERTFLQYPDMHTSIKNWKPWAKRCDGYGGSEIVEVIRRAWERANAEDRDSINENDMAWACQDFRPQAANAVEIAQMSYHALRFCSSNELGPPDIDGKIAHYERFLTQRGVLRSTPTAQAHDPSAN